MSSASTIWLEFLGRGVSETFYDVKGIRTRVLEAGPPSAHPLVMLHGTGGHAETYHRNIGPLSEHFRVYAIDMIGHGYTDQDFATLLLLQAKASGIELQPENVEIGDGLSAESGSMNDGRSTVSLRNR